MKTQRFLQEDRGFQSRDIPPIVALGVGVLLWFEPALSLPVLQAPLDRLLHWSGGCCWATLNAALLFMMLSGGWTPS
jgi:hypothetical protein